MPKNSMKLKHVLLLPFILLMTLAVLITSFFTWKYSEETTIHLGDQISKQSTYRMEEKLDSYLSSAKSSNQLIKQAVQYNLIETNNRKDTSTYIYHTVLENPNFGTLSLAYPDGSYIGFSNTVDGTILKKVANPDTNRVFYTYKMPSEIIIQEKSDYDARKRPWFIEAKSSREPIWSSVFEMYSDSKLGITYSEAVHKDEKLIGVVGTDVVFHDLNEQLDKIRLTDNSYLFILDSDNNVIAQSDVAETHQGSGTLHSVDESNNSLLKQAVKYIYQHDDVKSSAFHGDSYFEINNIKADYFVNFIPYTNGKGLKWYIGVVIPKSDFLGHVNEVRKNTFFIWLISFILSIILGLTITYLINRAIKRLHNSLQDIEATGSMYEHVHNHKIQEVNDLSMAFSLMSKRLHESYLDVKLSNDVLEDIVKERTEDLKAANAQLLKESHTDELTGLANRHKSDYLLKFYWDNLMSDKINSLSLLSCNLDCFKQYNNIYGHSQGDECLKVFAKILEDSITDLDVASRVSGVEFMIILPNTSHQKAATIAQNIMQKLAVTNIKHEESMVGYVTTSIGVTSTEKVESISYSKLRSHADTALYKAKQNGKNQYVVYQD